MTLKQPLLAFALAVSLTAPASAQESPALAAIEEYPGT